jgi:hypothetical protein
MLKIEHITQVRSKKIVCYTKFSGQHKRTERQKESAENLKKYIKKFTPISAYEDVDEDTGEIIDIANRKKTYSGKMTVGAKKRLIRSIENLVSTAKRNWIENPATGGLLPFNLGFTTLTIHNPSRMIDDGRETYHNLLSPFLQWLRRTQGVNLYIWKAELQERGMIHYHLLLGSFVHMDKIRAKWNKLQRKHGYLDDYFAVHGHYNAPSTEIKNALENEDIAGYLIKEISKKRQNEDTINAKVWDCSDNLKEMAYFELDTDKYQGAIAWLLMSSKLQIKYSDKACTVYESKDFYLPDMMSAYDRNLYDKRIDHIKNNFNTKSEELLKPDIGFKMWDNEHYKNSYAMN